MSSESSDHGFPAPSLFALNQRQIPFPYTLTGPNRSCDTAGRLHNRSQRTSLFNVDELQQVTETLKLLRAFPRVRPTCSLLSIRPLVIRAAK